MADEIRVQVLHEEGKTPELESWMWSVMTGRSELNQTIYFMYASDRRQRNAQVIMDGFSGTTVADALSAYDKFDGGVHANDWAHMHRKFVDMINSAPKRTDMSDSLAARILVLINALFRYDRALRPESMSYDEIASMRDKKQRLVVDEIFVKPKKYMTYLFEKLPLIDIENEKQIDELMPWSESLPEELKSKERSSIKMFS